MKLYVADVSMTAAWCFADEATPFTTSLLAELENGNEFLAPALWRYELANILLVAVRQGRITSDDADDFFLRIQNFAVVDMASFARDFSQVRALARRHRLTFYDAAYLELALHEKLPLATFDKDLRKAAQSEGVSLLPAS